MPTTAAEERAFQEANHANTRQGYVTGAALNMGWNLPSATEVESLYKPKIERALLQIESHHQAARNELSSTNRASVQIDKLLTSTSMNASLASARLGRGGGSPPPPEFRKAFAFFDPGDGKGGRFVIADVTESRWKDNDRYDFLKVALFRVPEGGAEGVKVVRSVAFYPDPASKRLFMTVYEASSKRMYCFEGDRQEAALLVPAPIGSPKGGVDIRAQVADLLLAIRRGDRG
jgi:hypothetical protein